MFNYKDFILARALHHKVDTDALEVIETWLRDHPDDPTPTEPQPRKDRGYVLPV